MKEKSLQLVLHRISQKADKARIASYFDRGQRMPQQVIEKMLSDLPRVVCEVSNRSEGELLQASLDALGGITEIETMVTDLKGHYSLKKKHHQILRKELSKALRSRTSLAVMWVQISADDPDVILPSMLGNFQEAFAAHFRESDTILGIDEDKLLLLGFATDRKGALLVQTRIKQSLLEAIPEVSEVQVGFSIFPDEGRSIADLFKQAKPVETNAEAIDPIKVRTATRKSGTQASGRKMDQQRIGTIQYHFTRARGRLFQRLLSLDAKALWHGLSKLTPKERREFVNRLPFDYKLAPTLNKIITANPEVIEDKQLEKHLEEVIYAMTFEEGLGERRQNAEAIINRLKDVDALPVLPSVAVKLFNILADPDAMLDALAKVIETDPTLTLRLLKVVNSAFYGVYRKIDTVKDAAVILGTEEIKNLAFGLSAAKSFQNIHVKGSTDPNALWHHSLGTAIIAEKLCSIDKKRKGEGAFTAGLVHDAGKIFLMEHFPELYSTAHSAAVTHQIPVFEMEEETYGVNHAMIGKVVADRWNLPETLLHTISCHHHHKSGASQDISVLAAIIGLSDYLYYRVMLTELEDGGQAPPPVTLTFGQFIVLEQVFKGFDDSMITDMTGEMMVLLKENQDLFSLT